MEWYYILNGERFGPVEEDALDQLAAKGRINAQTLVWTAEMPNWLSLGQVRPNAAVSSAPAVAPAITAYPQIDSPPAAATAEPGLGSALAMESCVECGRSWPREDMVQYAGSWVCPNCKPTFFQKIKEGLHVGAVLDYAGFWIRFGAKVIDGLIMVLVQFVIMFIFGAMGMEGVGKLVNFIIQVGYVVYFNGRFGATLGKMTLGLKIVRADGSPISFARALGRYFAEILSSIILAIGYIMAAFDDQKRALHDRICDTRVIRTRAS